jgi:hypothetical protein
MSTVRIMKHSRRDQSIYNNGKKEKRKIRWVRDYCEALLNEVFGRNDFVHLKTGKIGGESVLNIWTSVYSTLKEGVMKNCEELHTQRQIYEMFDTLVKGSLERIRKVAENPAARSTLTELDLIVEKNIEKVEKKKAKPILSDLKVIEKKMTSNQFLQVLSDEKSSTSTSHPKVKSEFPPPEPRPAKKLRTSKPDGFHEGVQSILSNLTDLTNVGATSTFPHEVSCRIKRRIMISRSLLKF